MNSKIRRLALGMLACYIALFVQLNILQVQRQEQLEADPRNDRRTIREFNRPRGEIVSADGVVLARSSPVVDPDSRFRYQREYPTGSLFAHVTGYTTFSFGSTQLERTQNDVLTGTTSLQQVRAIRDILGNDDQSGSVVLTMRADVQEVARQALVDANGVEREGSVVVMDPRTGAVLAMFSFPTFDPNQIAVHDAAQVTDVLAFLNAYPGKPLLANAYQERYMPGSAFKVITTGIAFENGVTSMERSWPEEREWLPPQTTDPIENYGGTACGGTMIQVFARSCNIAFAQMSVELGPQRMIDGVQAWGVGEPIPFDLPGAVSSFFGTDPAFFADRLPLLAIGGFGQGDTQMVPLHMAMVASTVANGGRMMAPHVIDVTRYHDGTVMERTSPEVWRTPISNITAQQLNLLMQEVVNSGTGRTMQLAGGIQAAAKTGTAQLNASGEEERSHAWIIGFAPAEAPRYAIAVMLKGTNAEISAGTGGRLAGPIAKEVLDYLFATEQVAP